MGLYVLLIIQSLGIAAVSARNNALTHRDGPIGLEGNIHLRNSSVDIKRHNYEIKNEHAPEIERLNKEMVKDMSSLGENVHDMSELMANNEEYSILNMAPMNYNFDFIPEWFNALPPTLSKPKEIVFDLLSSLAHMGLMSLISTSVFQNSYCTVFSSEMEKVACLKKCAENVNKIAQTGKQIMSLNFRSLSGGRTANEALVALNALAANPDNISLIKTLGTTIVMYITLMREMTGDETKLLAGSVMTKLTDLPIASNIANITTGGFGRVNVIIPRPSRTQRPDYEIAKLKAGASEREILSSM